MSYELSDLVSGPFFFQGLTKKRVRSQMEEAVPSTFGYLTPSQVMALSTWHNVGSPGRGESSKKAPERAFLD